jgi:hypothetical protein
MSAFVPTARLLLACVLLILTPILLAVTHQSPLWLLLALVPLTTTSCVLQNFRGVNLVVGCAASNALMLASVYLATLCVFWLIT